MNQLEERSTEFRIVDILHSKKFISDEKYEEYKKMVAADLLNTFRQSDKRPWWKKILDKRKTDERETWEFRGNEQK